MTWLYLSFENWRPIMKICNSELIYDSFGLIAVIYHYLSSSLIFHSITSVIILRNISTYIFLKQELASRVQELIVIYIQD